MKTKNIYIIRHGQTDYNLNNIVQGRGVNSSLNETGREQSTLFFEAYRHIKFDKIYTSALKRTKESVQGFADLGIPVESHTGLDEISWGKHEGQSYDRTMHQIYLEVTQAWGEGRLEESVKGGETALDVMNRQKVIVDKIISSSEETILMVSHGRSIRIMICRLLRYPMAQMTVFEHTNLCLYHLHFAGGYYSLVKRADINHLRKKKS